MFHTLSHVFSFRLLFWEHSESVTRIGQCRPCPIGTVNNGTGNVECSFCSDGLTTVSVGSVAGDCAVEELDEAPTFLVILIASVIVGCVLCGLCLFVVYKLVLEYRQWRQTTQEMKAQRLLVSTRGADGWCDDRRQLASDEGVGAFAWAADE